MAKIVGRSSKNVVECSHCGAEIEFTKSDIRAGEKLSHDDHRAVIVCPRSDGGCGRTIPLGSRTVSAEQAERERFDSSDYDL